MSEITFTFAEFNSKEDLNLLVKNIGREVVGAITEQMTTVPGMMGAAYEGRSIGSKVFTIDVLLKAATEEERVVRLKDIGTIVEATKGAYDFPLTFSDEPGVTYWSHITSFSSPSRVIERGSDVEFTIIFTCSEGVGHGEKVLNEFADTTVEINPVGTSPTYPVLSLQVGETITKAGVATEDDFVYTGNEDESGTSPTSNRILNDPCNSAATWTKVTTPTWVLENAKIDPEANIGSTGKALEVTKKADRYFYGTLKEKGSWRGAARYQGLSKPLKDWKITARFYINNRYARSRTKVELYLLNSMGIRIGKLMVKDNGIDLQNHLQAQIGTASSNKEVFLSSRDANKITKKRANKKITITTSQKRKTTNKKAGYKKGDVYASKTSVTENDTENIFSDFYGTISLEKRGNKYVATVQRFGRTGAATGKPYVTKYTDVSRKFEKAMGDLAGFGVYFGEGVIDEDFSTKPATYKQNITQLSDLKVWDLETIPKANNIAEEGDELIFDFEAGRVLKNGEPIPFAIGSNFFSMPPGQVSALGVMPAPSDKFQWDISYIPRYL